MARTIVTGGRGRKSPLRSPSGFVHPASPMQLSASNDLAQRSLAIIMGGGAGTRLFPLTKERAKPAVPLGGKYRLVDIPSPTASTAACARCTS